MDRNFQLITDCKDLMKIIWSGTRFINVSKKKWRGVSFGSFNLSHHWTLGLSLWVGTVEISISYISWIVSRTVYRQRIIYFSNQIMIITMITRYYYLFSLHLHFHVCGPETGPQRGDDSLDTDESKFPRPSTGVRSPGSGPESVLRCSFRPNGSPVRNPFLIKIPVDLPRHQRVYREDSGPTTDFE